MRVNSAMVVIRRTMFKPVKIYYFVHKVFRNINLKIDRQKNEHKYVIMTPNRNHAFQSTFLIHLWFTHFTYAFYSTSTEIETRISGRKPIITDR